ncbi:LuxR C-terminal-related transcriptional regulator [Streptomyces sp. GESEQ-35]|uniref:helix-turn-helix transcriptional regulator n=1 Tax=Streptomyces sp. GESEQ-35 TaxID=2812657 RepID=UPI001B344852|nr:LuxR C-terminal-related transcriptional regulator [Streptomyces sp. GESEQ-35]
MQPERHAGSAAVLPALQAIALMLDRFEQAEQLIRMAVARSAEVGVADALATELALSHLLAIRGDQAEVWQRTSRVLAFAVPHGDRMLAARARWLRGLAALGAGDPESALHELREGVSGHPAVAAWAVADIAEAAIAVGRQDVANAVLARARRERYGIPRRLEFRAAALTAEESDAERLFLAALQDADTAAMPFTDARARFAYGSWLARRHRTTTARSQLTCAHRGFAALGADGWTRRVAAELQAARAGDAGVDPYGFTPRERQIAWLAAQGLSNQEIGWRLGLSPRTVGSHLSHVFPKVGIASRAQLSGLDLTGIEMLPG